MSKNLELEAGVSSALDERRGLLERCVAAESETERYDVHIKEIILRKYEYQQKVLKFQKTSLLSQNMFIESRFLNGSTAPLATISILKRFHSERI